jgi:alcohol dehydrogenase (NADP+)
LKFLKYSNGDEMPMIGFGTYYLSFDDAYDVIRKAIRIGYRHFDCAPIFDNQEAIGKAIKDAIKAGEVTRKDLWITSKLWNDRHRYNDVEPACEKILDKMNLDYLDLFLINWPVSFEKKVKFPERSEDYLEEMDAPMEDTWTGMEDCQDAKLTRHIGLSNFNIARVQQVLNDCMMPPEINQCEWHPYLPQQSLYDYCRLNKILMTAFAPLGSPGREAKYTHPNEPFLLTEPAIAEIAKKHGCTEAQALIAFALKRKTAAIVKASNEEHMKENLGAEEVNIDREDLRSLIVLSKYRYFKGDEFTSNGSPYKLTDLWEY